MEGTDPVMRDPSSQEEWERLISEAKGGYIPFSPTALGTVLTELAVMGESLYYQRTSRDDKSKGTPNRGSTNMARLPVRYKASGGSSSAPLAGQSEKARRAREAASLVGKGFKKAGVAAGTAVTNVALFDAVMVWASENPDAQTLVEKALERGGILWEDLLKDDEGLAMIAREAKRLGVPVDESEVSSSDDDGYFGPQDESITMEADPKDVRYMEVERVLKALNITSEEYLILLNALENHSAQDVYDFRVKREQFNLQRM